MASCNVVNVLCPNGRRQKIKLSPQMTLLQLIHDVCKKQNLNPNNCSIRHQRKVLDSSTTVRFANLPNNAHLELIESTEERVHTALQLESGDRLVHEFNSDESLLKILQYWKSQPERITYNENADGVVCIYANQEVRGLEKLKSTTLSMIGLNGGRGVIRLIQQSPTAPEKDESEMMEGVCEKANPQNDKTETMTAPSVVDKLSTEEMELASRSASSVSMTSQGSEDYSMQCTETALESKPPCEKTNLSNQLDTKTSTKSSKNKKDGKTHIAMDIEQCEPEGHSSATNIEAKKESSVLSSSATTSASAGKVQVFSGVGRTLAGTEPDSKKPRIDPSTSVQNESRSVSEENTNVLVKDHENAGPSNRETAVFRLGESGSTATDDISDDFFEVTVDDLRLMLKDLKNERTVEEPLMTKSMREMREKSKMDQYEKVAIRIYFPDRFVLQGFFSPKERVSAVNHFVKENLHKENTDFYLYTTPPRILLDKPSMTLYEAKLFPTAVIHFGTRETQEHYLNSNLVQKMTNITEANEKVGRYYSGRPSTASSPDATKDESHNAHTVREDNGKPTVMGNTETPNAERSIEDPHNSVRRNVDKAVPKWFKLGK